MRNLELSLLFRFRDQASGVAKRAAKDIENAAKQAAAGSTAAARQEADAHIGLWRRVTESRKTLGIRSEQEIRAEIRRTQEAYQALAQSGTLSAREQARAAKAMKDQVQGLNRELRGAATTWERIRSGRGLIGMAGGALGVMHALKEPVSQTMSYDRRIALMSNTAFAEEGKAGRLAGASKLDAAIINGIRVGGGTREEAAEALDFLISSGALGDGAKGRNAAMNLLPTLLKYGTGTGAMPQELGSIAARALQGFNIKESELTKALDMSIVGGQAGGSELKDQAKWLPQQMALASQLGMSGLKDYGKLVAWNQASVITAGTKDEAGNNLRDLLNEVNTPHFRGFMAKEYLAGGRKLRPGERNKLSSGIDDVFLDYQNRGINKVDATVDMMQQIFAKNKKFQALQEQMRTLGKNDPQRQSVLEAMAAQVQGTSVGKIFHNQQSLMAMVALMSQGDLIRRIEGQMPNASGAGQTSFDVVASTADFKTAQAKNESDIAKQSLFRPLNDAIGSTAEKLTAYAREYPALTEAIVGAKTALGALTMYIGGSGLANILAGGGNPLARAGQVSGELSGAGGAIGGTILSRVTGAIPWLAPLTLSGDSGKGTSTDANQRNADALQTQYAMLNKGYVLQKGFFFDSYEQGTQTQVSQQLAEVVAALKSLKIDNHVHLDGQQIASSVNDHNLSQSNRQ